MTPGPPKPARELYGVMLLERGMAQEAFAAFRSHAQERAKPAGAYWALPKPPRNPAIIAKAQTYYQKVVAIAGGADNTRTEVTDARAHLK